MRRLLLLNGVFLTILSGIPSQVPELPSSKLQQPQPTLIQPLLQQQALDTRGVEPQIPGTIRIVRFEFVGNTAFSDR